MSSERSSVAGARVRARDITIGTLVVSAVVHAGLVPQHTDEPLLAAAFAAAAVAAAVVAYLLTRPGHVGQRLAVALLVGLLLAYPAVHLVSDLHVDVLDFFTKAVEAVGLFAALSIAPDEDAPLAPVDALVGVFIGTMLLSALGHSHGG